MTVNTDVTQGKVFSHWPLLSGVSMVKLNGAACAAASSPVVTEEMPPASACRNVVA
jgi:hypothetical protein